MQSLHYGTIVVIRDLNVLSHKKMKGMEQIINPYSEIHLNNKTIPRIHPNVNQNPDAYTRNRVYNNTEPVKNRMDIIAE